MEVKRQANLHWDTGSRTLSRTQPTTYFSLHLFSLPTFFSFIGTVQIVNRNLQERNYSQNIFLKMLNNLRTIDFGWGGTVA